MTTVVTGAASPQLTWDVAHDVRQLFAYHFMVNAYLAGTIVAVLAGAIGWFMVLRRQSFAGHTLAVITFPGAAGAVLIGVSAVYGYFAFAVAGALVIALVPSSGGRRYAGESAVIGTVQALALASGALFVSLYGGLLYSVTSDLFGTFLGISNGQVVVLLVVAVAALTLLVAIGRRLYFATIDPDVARARGIPTRATSAAFLVLMACAAAETAQITGVLLVFALLVMPAAAAQRLSASPATSLVLTLVLGLLVSWLGLGVSYFSPYPVGFWISTFGFCAFVLSVVARSTHTWVRGRAVRLPGLPGSPSPLSSSRTSGPAGTSGASCSRGGTA